MWLNGLLILILVICCYTDIKSRKIYNKLLFPALFLALAFHLIMGGWSGFLHALLGFAVGLAILLLPFFFGGMGAGDVKLLALVGAIKGTVFVFQSAIYMSLIGAIIALVILLFGKGRIQAIGWFLFSRYIGMKTPLLLDKSKKVYPYGVAIAGGAFVGLLLNGKFLIW